MFKSFVPMFQPFLKSAELTIGGSNPRRKDLSSFDPFFAQSTSTC